MKALIQKELRENLKIGVIGLIVFTVLAVGNYRYYAGMMEDVALGLRSASGYWYRLQPLASDVLITQTGFLAAVFGALLGWTQIYHERHRDLWAFLIHRPATRNEIFFSKVIAGVAIYLTAVLMPFAGFLLWDRLPGNVAAPFEWGMLLPFLKFYLAGIAFYFAGMLTSLRQARWYGSRALAMGMAFVTLLLGIFPFWTVWQNIFALLFGCAILAAAVWGGIHSRGQYQGQPVIGKMALIASLAPGVGLVVIVGALALVESLPNWVREYTWSHYVMSKEGVIYKQTQGGGHPAQVEDLNGKLWVDAVAGLKIDSTILSQYTAATYTIDMDYVRRPRLDEFPPTYFDFWREKEGEVWYYLRPSGRLVGYNTVTRRFIGSIGPDGFSKEWVADSARFRKPGPNYGLSPVTQTVNTPEALYDVDTFSRASTAVFKAEPGDSIILTQDIWLENRSWDYTIVVTKKYIHLLTAKGRLLWKTPFEPSYPQYSQISVCFLKEPGQFAVWLKPSYFANKKSGFKLPTHVVWLAQDRGELKRSDLPSPPQITDGPGLPEKLMSVVTPSPFWVVASWLKDPTLPAGVPWGLVMLGLAVSAVIWVPAGWWLGNRYRFDVGAQLGWAMFHLIFGLPGFLTFLAVQEWPVREPCPACRKLRMVDHEHCEHCGAGFAPPEVNGTEIFEPLSASVS